MLETSGRFKGIEKICKESVLKGISEMKRTNKTNDVFYSERNTK